MRPFSAIAVLIAAAISNSHAGQLQSIKAFQTLTPYQVVSTEPRQWNTNLSFGQWHTASPEQTPTSGFGLAILGVPTNQHTQSYQFSVTDGQQWQYLECIGRNHLTKITQWPIKSNTGQKPALACGIKGATDKTFYLNPEWDQQFVGHSELSDRTIKIRSLHHINRTAYPTLEPAGYLLTDEQGAIAQVEVLNKGRVWLRPDLSAQTQLELAARITALLLFNPKNS
jgi:hypothetical protein